jgi:hypothetical protein
MHGAVASAMSCKQRCRQGQNQQEEEAEDKGCREEGAEGSCKEEAEVKPSLQQRVLERQEGFL